MIRSLVVSAVAFLVSACGGLDFQPRTPLPPPPVNGPSQSTPAASKPSGGSADADPNTNPTFSSIALASESWDLIEVTDGLVEAWGKLAVDAAASAGVVAGQSSFVTTGTLTEPRTASDDWTYSPAPNTRLDYVHADGTTTTYVFKQIQGSFASGEDFWKDAHNLDVTIQRVGFHAVLKGTGNGSQVSQSIDVTWGVEEECSSNLNETGWRWYNSDYGYLEYESELQSNGSVTCGALVVDLDRKTASSVSQGGGISSISATREFSYRWAKANIRYELTNGRTGNASNQNGTYGFYASGELSRDGNVVGGLSTTDSTSGTSTLRTSWLTAEDGSFKIGSTIID